MRHILFHRVAIAIAAASVWIAATAAPASADNLISNCNHFCKLNCAGQGANCKQAVLVGSDRVCKLNNSVICNTVQSLLLYDGTDLDMSGKNLECIPGFDCGDGVQMLGFGSRVFNSSATTASIIKGRFASAVQCQNRTGSQVQGIIVEDAFSGMTSCQIVKNNVIRKANRFIFAGNYGIIASGVTTTGADLIEDNYIEDRVYGMGFSAPAPGKTPITVRNNVVHTGDIGGCGIWVQSGANPNVNHNTFLSTGVPALDGHYDILCLDDASPLGTYDENVCDKDHPRCLACQLRVVGGEPVCARSRAPFPASHAAAAQITLKNLGTALSGAETSTGWTGAGHHGESPEGAASPVGLTSCIESATDTTCQIFSRAQGEVGSIGIAEPLPDFFITSVARFQSAVTGEITFNGDLPLSPGPVDVTSLELTADQIVHINFVTQGPPPTCDGDDIGDAGFCQGFGFTGTEPCTVDFVGSLGNTSIDCDPGTFNTINPDPITLTTGTATLAATVACDGDLCHCTGQIEPNNCPDQDCAASETCTLDAGISCFPSTISRTGSISPLTLVGVGCTQGFVLNNDLGIPGPVALVQGMEVEAIP